MLTAVDIVLSVPIFDVYKLITFTKNEIYHFQLGRWKVYSQMAIIVATYVPDSMVLSALAMYSARAPFYVLCTAKFPFDKICFNGISHFPFSM